MQDLQQKTWKRSLCALPPPPPPPETAGTRVTKARLGQPAPGEKSGTAPWPAGPLCWKRRMEAAGSAGRGKKKKKKRRSAEGRGGTPGCPLQARAQSGRPATSQQEEEEGEGEEEEEEEESKAEFVPYRSATLTLSASGSEQMQLAPLACRSSAGTRWGSSRDERGEAPGARGAPARARAPEGAKCPAPVRALLWRLARARGSS
ncbi:unnamed protein product, partial [Prorocentrum cordatum]